MQVLSYELVDRGTRRRGWGVQVIEQRRESQEMNQAGDSRSPSPKIPFPFFFLSIHVTRMLEGTVDSIRAGEY